MKNSVGITAAKEVLIHEICEREWQMFDKVNNTGGRASCQNDADFFKAMRTCQFSVWNEATLVSYLNDLDQASQQGRNLLSEKYAYMMEYTHPAEFEGIRGKLPPISEEKAALIREIIPVQLEWEREVDTRFPAMRANGRPLTHEQDTPWVTSFETYLEGELKTYSQETLRCYADYIRSAKSGGLNLAWLTAERTALAYGFTSLEEAERVAAERAQSPEN